MAYLPAVLQTLSHTQLVSFVWGISSSSGSRAELSLSEPGLSSLGAGRYHRLLFQYLDCICLPLIDPCRRIGAYFRFLSFHLVVEVSGTLDLMIFPCPFTQQTEMISMFEPPCLITQQTGVFLLFIPLVNWLRKQGYCKRPWISFRVIYLWR